MFVVKKWAKIICVHIFYESLNTFTQWDKVLIFPHDFLKESLNLFKLKTDFT
jgi:Mlc titration factor MtfA (ptsG expression regulator)